jgi:hypothetical protein
MMPRLISPPSNIRRTTCFEGPPARIHSASDERSRGRTMSFSQASSKREIFTRLACPRIVYVRSTSPDVITPWLAAKSPLAAFHQLFGK